MVYIAEMRTAVKQMQSATKRDQIHDHLRNRGTNHQNHQLLNKRSHIAAIDSTGQLVSLPKLKLVGFFFIASLIQFQQIK